VLSSVTASTEQDLTEAFRAWAKGLNRPPSSILYVVCHGQGDGIDHDLLVTEGGAVVPVRTTKLVAFLQDEWLYRQQDPDSWALFVLDCCDSDLGVDNVAAELRAKHIKRPRRLEMWPAAPGGAIRAGVFVTAFENALETFNENDDRIALHEVFRRMRREIGELEPEGFLPDSAALDHPTPPKPIVMAVDVLEELREAIADRPPEVRSHFIAKAQGNEVGEVAWHFTGRESEIRQLSDWLRHGTGLRAVTGEAGSGKSALLGQLVVLADPELVDLYVQSGLAPHLAEGPRPPDRAFGAIVHLTGKTAIEAADEIARQLAGSIAGGEVAQPAAGFEAHRAALFGRVQALEQLDTTVLVDALDESQAPETIASLLHGLSVLGPRVLVGTRRSITEGPDQPADPTHRELLDALHAADDEIVVVERDAQAVESYALQRLRREGSPYANNPEHAEQMAARIAGADQPFLFARLATAELLKRPAMSTTDPALNELLGHGHRGVFAAAVDRIGAADFGAVDMLRALAHARGRGMPQTGGIWVDAARAVGAVDDASDARVQSTLKLAGAYVTLDAEAGQSTYRLAHQTFVEHFHALAGYGVGHRQIARELAHLQRSSENGWSAANHYVVRYLSEHMVADSDRTPPDSDGLRRLVTDAGWLARAVDLLGVDQVVELIAAAKAITTQDDLTTGMPSLRPIDAVERVLRRSRVALGWDPSQLPGLIHARLQADPDQTLAGLGEALGSLGAQPWLRMVEGRLDWTSDLESTYTTVGKIRGVACGAIGEQPVVAIAKDRTVVLWNPRRGSAGAAVIQTTHKPTAVAVAAIDGRPVVVTTSAYEEGLTIEWDAVTGEVIASSELSLGHAIAVGRVGGQLVIAGIQPGGTVSYLDASSMQPVDVAAELRGLDVRGFGVDDGRLLALAVEAAAPGSGGMSQGAAYCILVVDPSDGVESWRSPVITSDRYRGFDAVAGGRIGPAFLVVAGVGLRSYWLTAGDARHIEESPYNISFRALAVGSIDGRPIVVSAPDYDSTTLVMLHQVEYELTEDGVTLFRQRADEGSLAAYERFDHVPVPAELSQPHRREMGQGFPLDKPENWPYSVAAAGELNDSPIIATGSVEGAVWIWDVASGRPRSLAGPFADLPDYVIESGWDYLNVKPPLELASAVALGDHPDRGLIVAVAWNGNVRMYEVPSGRPIQSSSDRAAVVDAVDLGTLNQRAVLVTGSTGGVLAVWDLATGRRVAALTLDDPITDVRIDGGPDAGGQITVRTGAKRDYVFRLIER
jgi:hypothetical protein